MQTITPFLWFDNQAEEAVSFYTSIFEDGKESGATRYGESGSEISGKPRGSVMTVPFKLERQSFIALNGGPHFTFNPSISFFVTCETEEEVDRLWKKLNDGGSTLMELQKYEWSEKYGWLQDRHGLSWQIFLGRLADVGQKVTPSLLFVGKQHGRAEEAVKFYTSIFKDSRTDGILRYASGEDGQEGTVKHAQFALNNHVYMAMDGGLDHAFAFNEAISFVVNCATQEEIDYYWKALSEGGDPNAQRCGWLKDRFGVSWQIVPTILGQLMQGSDAKKSERMMNALLKMTKLNMEELQRAYDGE